MSTGVNSSDQEGVFGAVPTEKIRSVFQLLEGKMRRRNADTIRVMIVFSYVLLKAREWGAVTGEIPEDLRFAFKIVSGLHYTVESSEHIDELFAIRFLLSLNLGRDAYLEVFHEELKRHTLRLFDRDSGAEFSGHNKSPKTNARLGQDISRYGDFLNSHLGLHGKRILDFDARFSLLEDLSIYEKYCIIEENEYFRAFFILRKYLEGWNNVTVLDRYDCSCGETFEAVKFSSNVIDFDENEFAPEHYDKAIPNYERRITILRLMESIPKAVFVFQYTGGLIKPWSFCPASSLDEVISLTSHRVFPDSVYILRPDRDHESPITFVEGRSIFHSLKVSETLEFKEVRPARLIKYFSEIQEAISSRNPRFVIDVRPDELKENSLDPLYYLFREEMRTRGSIPLSAVLSEAVIEPCPPSGDGPILMIQDDCIIDDERLREIEPKVKRHGYYDRYKVSSPVLLVGQRAGHFNPDNEHDVGISASIAAFFVKEDLADRRYLVKYLNDIASGADSRYGSSMPLRFILDCIYLPDLTVAEQRAVVDNHLRAIADDVMNGLGVRDVGYQILVVTADKDHFRAIFGQQLEGHGFKVLDYVEGTYDLESVLRSCHGEGVPASRTADAVIADARLSPMAIQQVMYEVRGFGIPLFFCAEGTPDQAGKGYGSELGFLSEKFEEMLVVGPDALRTVKKRLNDASGDYLQRYAEFFAAARRFDDDYPEWGLGRYAADILSRKPFHLDLRDFRTRIDKYIGGYLRDNGVVPADPALFEDGAIPELLFRPPYEDKEHGIKVSLYEYLDKGTRKKEAWIRSAYVTIRKLCNIPAHDAGIKFHPSVEEAAFTLFMEIVKWLDRVEVRERYQSGKVKLVVEGMPGEGGKGPEDRRRTG